MKVALVCNMLNALLDPFLMSLGLLIFQCSFEKCAYAQASGAVFFPEKNDNKK